MLAARLLVSAVLIPAFVALFVLDHRAGDSAPYLLALCLLIAARGVWEMTDLLRTRSFAPQFPETAACTLAVVSAGWWSGTDAERLAAALVVFSLGILALFFLAAVRYRAPGRSLENLGAETLIVAYVGVLLTVTAQLRWVAGAEAGYLALGSLIIAAKSGDIGAYTLGRLFGRRKMVPRLSPGKTWMGGAGALIGAGLGGWLWLHFATPQFNVVWTPPAWYWAVLYGAIIGVVGLVGDLCESLIKRDVDRKDSAALMPGFGGLLDLIDSVIYAGPVAYVLWRMLPLAPSTIASVTSGSP